MNCITCQIDPENTEFAHSYAQIVRITTCLKLYGNYYKYAVTIGYGLNLIIMIFTMLAAIIDTGYMI